MAIGVRPSKNTTLPVGVPDAGDTATTVTVKVTGCPLSTELDDARMVASELPGTSATSVRLLALYWMP